jgi:hypothetical protein
MQLTTSLTLVLLAATISAIPIAPSWQRTVDHALAEANPAIKTRANTIDATINRRTLIEAGKKVLGAVEKTDEGVDTAVQTVGDTAKATGDTVKSSDGILETAVGKH